MLRIYRSTTRSSRMTILPAYAYAAAAALKLELEHGFKIIISISTRCNRNCRLEAHTPTILVVRPGLALAGRRRDYRRNSEATTVIGSQSSRAGRARGGPCNASLLRLSPSASSAHTPGHLWARFNASFSLLSCAIVTLVGTIHNNQLGI
jgi:hypothetical protein